MDPFTLLILPLLQPVTPVAAPVPVPYEVVQIPTLPDAGKAEAIINTQKPEVSLSRWDGEAQIKVSYLGVEAPVTPGTTSGSYIWKGTEASVEAFPIEANPEIVDGGFEFQVVLHERPPGNIFDFSVEGAENMDFNYQAPLDEAFKARNVSPKAVRCTPTQCFGKDGEVVSERPENVVGSYAVYAKDKKNHEIGGLNYGMGKMFHIYRPKAIAADGQWVWGTLDYTDGILSVTIPQEFLDTKKYPIIVDPTYGYTSLAASEDFTEGCDIYYHAGTFSGATGSTLTTAHWYGRDVSSPTTHTVWVALYSTGAVGSKTRLDVSSASLALTSSKASYEIPGFSYSGLTNGTAYFIEMNSDTEDGWRTEYDDTGTASSMTYHCNWMSEPPNPSGASETDEPSLNWSFSAYFDYTEPASAPTVTTSAASSVTSSTATLNGNVTATGGAAATTCGFAYGTVSTLVTVIATTTDSTCPASTGAFTKNLSSLSSNTTYYFRAYATNTGGTGLGSILNFTTSSAAAARTAIVKPANNLGLVGYWPFNEATSTKAGDFSGRGNTGSLSGSTIPSWASGKLGKALSFDGSSSYVNIPDTADTLYNSSFTLSAWIYPTSYPDNYSRVAQKGSSGGSAHGGYDIEFDSGDIEGDKTAYGVVWNGTTNSARIGGAAATLPLNSWTFVTFTYNGTTGVMYHNGIQVDSQDTIAMSAPDTHDFNIGNSPSGSNFFPGKIDEARVYNRVLTPAQVLALYKQGAARVIASSKTLQTGSTLSSGLVGLWTFDGGDTNWTSGSTGVAYDGSGNNNIGTLTSMIRTSSPTIGKLGQALFFDGSTNYISLASSPLVSYTAANTECAWVKTNDNTIAPGSISQTFLNLANDGSNTIRFGNNEGGPGGVFVSYRAAGTDVSAQTTASQVIPNNTWTHLCSVFNGTGIDIFANGVSVATTSAVGGFGVSSVNEIGVRHPGLGGFWFGSIDDVRVYNRALTALEVKQLYLLGRVLVKP